MGVQRFCGTPTYMVRHSQRNGNCDEAAPQPGHQKCSGHGSRTSGNTSGWRRAYSPRDGACEVVVKADALHHITASISEPALDRPAQDHAAAQCAPVSSRWEYRMALHWAAVTRSQVLAHGMTRRHCPIQLNAVPCKSRSHSAFAVAKNTGLASSRSSPSTWLTDALRLSLLFSIHRHVGKVLNLGYCGKHPAVASKLVLEFLQLRTESRAVRSFAECAFKAFAVPLRGKWPHNLVQDWNRYFSEANCPRTVATKYLPRGGKQRVYAVQNRPHVSMRSEESGCVVILVSISTYISLPHSDPHWRHLAANQSRRCQS